MSYRATLDVPIATVRTISGWLTAHRRAYDIRPHQRACTTWGQAVLVLRWLKDGTDVRTLARDAGVWQATGYRYLHEALEVVAQRSPEITDVLDRLRRDGEPFVCLDGTLVRTDRVATRTHALPALYRAASLGLPTLADKGYTKAGIGIKVPAKNPHPDRHQMAQRADQLNEGSRREGQRPDQALQDPQARHPRSQSHHHDRRRSPGHPHPPQRHLVRKPQYAQRNSATKPPQSIADTSDLGTSEYTKRPTINNSKGTPNTHATTELEIPRGSTSVGIAASICIKSPTTAPPNTGPA